ncbi:MAG: branched-chain amino acid ABC transporter permease, partial [Clostridiales bacterium]
EKLRDFADYAQLIYAVILVTVLIVRPAGLIPKRIRNYCALFGKKLRPALIETKKNPVSSAETTVVSE